MQPNSSPVDWRRARSVAEFVASRAATPQGDLGADVGEVCRDSAKLVIEYAQLEPKRALAPARTVDRAEWISANLDGVQGLLERPLARRLGSGSGDRSGVERRLSGVAGLILGAEVGGMLGYFSTRVLAQYTLELGSEAQGSQTEPQLLFVSPNLLQARRKLKAPAQQFIRWIAFHEVAHSVQFTAWAWLEDELNRLVDAYADRVSERLEGFSPSRLFGPLRDPRALIDRLRRESLSELLMTAQERALIERAQAMMSVIEGHAEHVMHTLGKRELPSYWRLAKTSSARHRHGAPERLLQRLLGIELKLRQYEQGRRFVDTVVGKVGIGRFNLVWSNPAALPTVAEIAAPKLWLKRVA